METRNNNRLTVGLIILVLLLLILTSVLLLSKNSFAPADSDASDRTNPPTAEVKEDFSNKDKNETIKSVVDETLKDLNELDAELDFEDFDEQVEFGVE